MATAKSADINIAEGIRKMQASGASRYWVTQRGFAKVAGAVDDARGAKDAKCAAEKLMYAWGRTQGKYSATVKKERHSGCNAYPICWSDGAFKKYGQCSYFDMELGEGHWEESMKGAMAPQLALATAIRALPGPLTAEAIYQYIAESKDALDHVFFCKPSRMLATLIPLFLQAEGIELTSYGEYAGSAPPGGAGGATSASSAATSPPPLRTTENSSSETREWRPKTAVLRKFMDQGGALAVAIVQVFVREHAELLATVERGE
jgi:hypothetical protein